MDETAIARLENIRVLRLNSIAGIAPAFVLPTVRTANNLFLQSETLAALLIKYKWIEPWTSGLFAITAIYCLYFSLQKTHRCPYCRSVFFLWHHPSWLAVAFGPRSTCGTCSLHISGNNWDMVQSDYPLHRDANGTTTRRSRGERERY